MAQLEVKDLTPAFGAEILGLDPQAELAEHACRQLRMTLDERGLLLFRGVDIDGEFQAHLAGMLIGKDRSSAGDEDPDAATNPFFVSNKEPGGGAPYGRLLFHSDMMWSDDPCQLLSLYAVQVDPPVVPTMFASTTNGWNTLPDDLRACVEGLHALHVTGQQTRGDDDGELLQPIREQIQSSTKPIGNPHPRTGRTMLYVCQMMTQEIVELPNDESEGLLEELFAHLYNPDNLWQHEWRNGDLVAWDNLAVQHARSDVQIDGPVRTLRKVIAPRPLLADRPETPRFSKVS